MKPMSESDFGFKPVRPFKTQFKALRPEVHIHSGARSARPGLDRCVVLVSGVTRGRELGGQNQIWFPKCDRAVAGFLGVTAPIPLPPLAVGPGRRAEGPTGGRTNPMCRDPVGRRAQRAAAPTPCCGTQSDVGPDGPPEHQPECGPP